MGLQPTQLREHLFDLALRRSGRARRPGLTPRTGISHAVCWIPPVPVHRTLPDTSTLGTNLRITTQCTRSAPITRRDVKARLIASSNTLTP